MKKINQQFKSQYYYIKLFLSYTICVITTIFFLTTILYFNFQNIGLSLIHSYIKDNLSQISYGAKFMRDSVKALSLQLYMDPNIKRILFSASPSHKEISAAIQALNNYRATTPNIVSIYIYNGKKNVFYIDNGNPPIQTKEEFFDEQIISIINKFQPMQKLMPIARRIPYSQNSNDNLYFFKGYTFVYRDSNHEDTVIHDAVVVNVSEEWLNNIIQAMDYEPGSDTFVINGEGMTLTTSSRYNILTDISREPFIKRIFQSGQKSGYFVEEVNGIEALVTFASSDALDWKFIRIIPYNNIMYKIRNMRNTTLLVASVILLCSFFVVIIASRIMYKPYNSVLTDLAKVENDQRRNFYKLRQEFLKSIINTNDLTDINKIKEKFNQFEISLNPENKTVLILLKIDKFLEFSEMYDFADRNMLKFGIMNIASELISHRFINEAVDVNKDCIVLLINLPDPCPIELTTTFDEIIREVQAAVKEHLNISLSAFISTVGNNILEANTLYYEVLTMSNYKLFYGYQCIIYAEQIKKRESYKNYSYPVNKEKQLINALILEKENEAIKIYKEIINETIQYSYDVFHLTFLRVLTAIQIVVDTIDENSYSNSSFSYRYINYKNELNQCETIEDINKKMFLLFKDIIQNLQQRKNLKHNEIINNVIRIIDKSYTDPNLSVQSIAEKINMTPVYLGKIFKKTMMQSITEYVNERRLKKAKELLIQSDFSIEEIAMQVGFSSKSYFYTVFKKGVGVTPNEYRQKKRINNENERVN